MKKIIIALIVILMLAMVFQGCEKTETEGETTPNETTAQAIEAADSEILVSELSGYKVIRPDSADTDTIEAAKLVYGAIKTTVCADVKLSTDFYKPNDSKYDYGEYEILIGITNRPESASFTADLRTGDYGYKIIGKKIIITGITPSGTYQAAEHFVNNIVNKLTADSENFYSGKSDYLYEAEYSVNSLTLDGTNINEFGIVYSNKNQAGEELLAQNLRDAIAELSGYVLDVYKDNSEKTKEHEIVVGVAQRDANGAYDQIPAENEYRIDSNGGRIFLWSGTLAGNIAAVNDLLGRINQSVTGKEASVTLEDKYLLKIQDDDGMTAMSFNVLVSSRSAERTDRVIGMITKYMPDTFGVQEASPSWISDLNKNLSAFYGYVGSGREGPTTGEYCAVFYRKDKFTVIDSGTKWLSDTPDVVSKYSDSTCYRIFTYAVFKRISDGKTIVHVNTHLEHTSSEARVKQAAVLIEFMKKYADMPVLLSGDFNCLSNSKEYKMIDETYLDSSSDVALSTENKGATYHNYGSASKIIDFIFVNPSKIVVSNYKVLNEKINGDYASDHHPVMIWYSVIG